MNYFLRWEGKDTNGKYIKGELRIKPKLAEPLLSQLIVLKVGEIVLKKVKKVGEQK